MTEQQPITTPSGNVLHRTRYQAQKHKPHGHKVVQVYGGFKRLGAGARYYHYFYLAKASRGIYASLRGIVKERGQWKDNTGQRNGKG